MWRNLFTHRMDREEEGASVATAQSVARLLYVAAPIALVAGSLLLYAYRLPSMHVFLGVTGYVCLVLALIALLPGLGALAFAFAGGGPNAVRAKPILWVLRAFGPALLLLTWLLIRIDVPRKLMFATNRTALDAFAAAFAKDPTLGDTPSKVGGYRFDKVMRIPGGFQASVAGTYSFRSVAFIVYLPYSQPGLPPPENYEPQGGGWFYKIDEN